MLKNKFKIIAILMVIILSLMVPIVRAENEEVATNEDVALISEDSVDETTTDISSKFDIKEEDIYLTGDDVTIDYIVDGNLFVFANTVTINSQIGGDAFIFAKTVNVSEQGFIYSNLFTIAQNVSISGTVYDVYALAQDITIDGYIYRDIKTSSNSLNINGIVGRNAFVAASNINFAQSDNTENSGENITSNGMIKGNLNYSSAKEISIPEGAVTGTTNFTETKKETTSTIQSYLLSLGRFLTTVAILWLLCLWITPKFLNNTHALLTTKTLPVIGYGILTPIFVSIAFIILLIIGITANIAFLAFSILFLLVAISSAIFVIAINNLVCDKLKVEKNIGKFGLLIVSAIVLWLINLIPYVGTLISFIASILGLGITVMSIIPVKKVSNKKDSKNEPKVNS